MTGFQDAQDSKTHLVNPANPVILSKIDGPRFSGESRAVITASKEFPNFCGPLSCNNHNNAFLTRFRDMLIATLLRPHCRESRLIARQLGLRKCISITIALKHEFCVITRIADDARRENHRGRSPVQTSYLKYFSI